MRSLKKFSDFAELAAEYALFLMMAAMVVIIFAQVIFRFVLQASLPWSEEAARYIMVWISMLGAAVGIRRKGHIGVEAVVLLFPERLKKATVVITTLVGCCFFAGMIFYGIRICSVVAAQESPAMEISMAIPYSSIVAGGMLMFLFSIEDLLVPRTADASGKSGEEPENGKTPEKGRCEL